MGEVARRTGLTVRTLHYYEEIGLLVPDRTAAGHRQYRAAHIERLHHITALKSLGFDLAAVGQMLDAGALSARAIIARQIEWLDGAIRQQQALRGRLSRLVARLDTGHPVTGEDLLQTLEDMMSIEQYYTPEQLEELARRRDQMGPDGMAAAQAKWTDLFADVRAAIDAGEPPDSATGRALAARQAELISAFTGGNPGIAQSLGNLWKDRGDEVIEQHGMDPAVMQWLGAVPRDGG